jgi:hypothetical protein
MHLRFITLNSKRIARRYSRKTRIILLRWGMHQMATQNITAHPYLPNTAILAWTMVKTTFYENTESKTLTTRAASQGPTSPGTAHGGLVTVLNLKQSLLFSHTRLPLIPTSISSR